MSQFLSTLHLQNNSTQDDGRWITTAPLIYESSLLHKRIFVPTGFKTDFASVPRIPFIYWLVGDTASEAAVVHDYLYTTKFYSRSKSDGVLLEASLCCKVKLWRAYLMWAGVRCFGWSHW